VKPYDKTWKTEMMRHTKSDIIDILGARLKGMGDEMKFPNEVWIDKGISGNLYISGMEQKQRYIHESRVPISCGGTMEENDSNALARADKSFLDKVDPDIRERAEQFIEDIKSGKIKKRTEHPAPALTSGSAEIPDIGYPCHACGIRKYGMCVDCKYNEEKSPAAMSALSLPERATPFVPSADVIHRVKDGEENHEPT
jgi:hypothetical protein